MTERTEPLIADLMTLKRQENKVQCPSCKMWKTELLLAEGDPLPKCEKCLKRDRKVRVA